jgi:hypothetical protein
MLENLNKIKIINMIIHSIFKSLILFAININILTLIIRFYFCFILLWTIREFNLLTFRFIIYSTSLMVSFILNKRFRIIR